jgi:hypothetical protein
MSMVLLMALMTPAGGVGGRAQIPILDGCAEKETIVKIVLISLKFKFFSTNLRVDFKLW